MTPRTEPYRRRSDAFTFLLEPDQVQQLKALPDFEGREEPAVAEDFLRFHAEAWAERLADARATPGEFRLKIDAHQRKVHLVRESRTVFSADL